MGILKKIGILAFILIIWAEINARVVYENMISKDMLSIDKITLKYGDLNDKNYLQKLFIKNDIVVNRAIAVYKQDGNPLAHIFKK